MRRPFLTIEWDDHNRPHVLRHGCTQNGVEDVLRQRCHPARVVEQQNVSSQPRWRVQGRTCKPDEYYGLAIIPKPDRVARPIACWNLADQPEALRRYQAWLRAVEARGARR